MRRRATTSPPRNGRRGEIVFLVTLLLLAASLAPLAAGQGSSPPATTTSSGNGGGFFGAISSFFRGLGFPNAGARGGSGGGVSSTTPPPVPPRPRAGRLRGINFPPFNATATAAAAASGANASAVATSPPAPSPPPAANAAKPTPATNATTSTTSGKSGGALLHIAHVNDVHNRIEETSTTSATCSPEQRAKGVCLGGWARIATAVADARRQAAADGAGFLFLDIGDEFDGTLWDIRYKGQATAAIQRIVRPDAMTLGNHEFAFPPNVLRAYIDQMKAPMLGACNVDVSRAPELRGAVQRWRVFDVQGRKVAALGWLTPDTGFLMPNAANITFTPVEESVRRCIADLKREHPDVAYIIGMSHNGYHRDLETAAAVPELDIILGGHSHTFLNAGDRPGPIFDTTTGATPDNCIAKGACDAPLGLFPTLVKTELCDPPSAGNASAAPAAANANNKQPRCAPKVVPVVQAYYASKYLGHLTIDLDARQLVASSPVLLGGPNSTNPVAPDPSITKLIKAMSGPVQELEARVAGRVDVRVIGGLPGRTRETNFGSLMADIVVRAGKRLNGLEKAFGPVDIGILTGGGIRSDIGPGNVTYGSVMAAMPFGNTLSIKSLTGAQIRAGLLHGLSGMKDTAGRFPQVSGLRMWHRGDALLDAVRLLPGGKTAPLDDAARYNVASTSYILNGGDGYAMFATGPPPIYPSGDPVDELLISALVAARPKAIPVPNPAKDRRIIDCAKAYVDCANAELYGPCCTRSG